MRTLLVAGNELRRRIRNRSALITAFLGPIALAVVFSVLVGGTGSTTFRIGVVNSDASAVSRTFVSGLLNGQAATRVRFEATPDRVVARHRVDNGDLDGAILIPTGFGAAAQRGVLLPLTAIRSPKRLIGGQVAESVALGIASRFEHVGLAVRAVAAAQGRAPTAAVIAAAERQAASVTLVEVAPGGREISAAAFYGASMSILFLFFTVGFGARSLLAERRDGTLARMLATPTAPGSILAGKEVAVSLLGVVGMVTVWAVTALAFGATWGSPWAVLTLILATVFAIAGVATLVASLARSERQADAYTSVVTFALALLGGNFIGPASQPELLKQLSLATPNGWALRAFTDLSADSASVSSIGVALGVLVGIGVVAGAIGLTRVYRVMAQ